MKVKVISRNPDDYIRDTKDNVHKIQRNYDPALHPFEAQREYVRGKFKNFKTKSVCVFLTNCFCLSSQCNKIGACVCQTFCW